MSTTTHGNGRPQWRVAPDMELVALKRPFGLPSTRTRLILAFTVVVLGLLGVEGSVFLIVHPQLSALHAIADDHARAVEEASRIRSRLTQMYRTLRAEVAHPGTSASPPRISAELQGLAASVSLLGSLAVDPLDRQQVQAFQDAIARMGPETARIEAGSALDDSASSTEQNTASLRPGELVTASYRAVGASRRVESDRPGRPGRLRAAGGKHEPVRNGYLSLLERQALTMPVVRARALQPVPGELPRRRAFRRARIVLTNIRRVNGDQPTLAGEGGWSGDRVAAD